jgi:hypothetical protein
MISFRRKKKSTLLGLVAIFIVTALKQLNLTSNFYYNCVGRRGKTNQGGYIIRLNFQSGINGSHL